MLPANLLICGFIRDFHISAWYECSTTKGSEEGASVLELSLLPSAALIVLDGGGRCGNQGTRQLVKDNANT